MLVNVKILTVFLIMLFLSGCKEDCTPVVITKVVIQKVPVKCKTKKVDCNYSGDRMQALTELIRCNYALKQANKECQ